MTPIISERNANISRIFLLINIILVIIIIYSKDPFGMRKSGYYSLVPIVPSLNELLKVSIQTIVNSIHQTETVISIVDTKEPLEIQGNIHWNGNKRSAAKKELNVFLDSIRDIRTFTPLGTERAKYGFDKLEYKIKMEFKIPESSPMELSISGVGDGAGGSFVFWDNNVYLIPYSIHTLLGIDPTKNLIRKQFLPENTDINDLYSVKYFKNGKLIYSLNRTSDNQFSIEPSDTNMNQEKIAKILENIINWKTIDIFVDFQKNWKSISNSNYSIHVVVKNSDLYTNCNLDCNWKDEQGNKICYSSDGEVYLQMYSIDLE